MACQFASFLDQFLLFYFEVDPPLKAPIKLLINGKELKRPFVAIPLEGLARCFVVVRRPSRLAKRAPRLELQDGTERVISWQQQDFPPCSAAPSGGLNNRDWLKLHSTLEVHLEKEFGALPPESWNQIASAIAARLQAHHFELPDGRRYVRIRLGDDDNRGLHQISYHSLASPDEPESAAAFAEAGWLHFCLTPNSEAKGTAGPMVLQLDNKRRIPYSFETSSAILPASNPLEAILAGLEGSLSGLREFLVKVLRIRPELSEESKALLKSLRGGIVRLSDHAITGWILDRRNPKAHQRVSVLLDGELVATIAADLPRPRVPEGNHGFALSLDPSLLDGSSHIVQLALPDQIEFTIGSEFRIGQGTFDGEAEISDGRYVTGWLQERCAPQGPVDIVISIDGNQCAVVNVPARTDYAKGEFRVELPYSIQDGISHRIEARLERNGQSLGLLGQPLPYTAKYRGAIVKCESGSLIGWVLNETAPSLMVMLDLYIDGYKHFTGETIPFIDANGKRLFGFSFNLGKIIPSKATQSVSLKIAGTDHEILGPQRLITPPATILQNLTKASALLRSTQTNDSASEWVRREMLAPLIREFRKSGNFPSSVTLAFNPVLQSLPKRSPSTTLDVVVPVFRGKTETLACLASVLETTRESPIELVVINDHSPETELTEALRDLAKRGQITLLENPRNAGFVASANRGLKLHPDRDVVLLNSDTVMPAEGIDRMRRVAYSNQAIGTVTPFSNNATICSFPQFNADNVIPEGWDLSSLDAELAKINGDRYVDIPTAVGFCMYIKRQVIDEIGLLDEQQWGKGYGEENDFCLRASTLGWRHVLAAGVFVQHHGSVSFGSDKSGLLATNLGKLNRLYPDYAPTIQQFLQTDPIAPYRNPVVIKLMREVSDRFMLYVSHSLGGGTQVATDDLAANLARENIRILELRSCRGDKWELKLHGTPYLLAYRANDWDTLLADLKLLNVWHVHFHQIPFFSKAITELGDRLGVPYDVTIHDYLPICPRINMLDETGWYCGDSQFDADTCNRCVRALGTDEGVEPLFAEHGNDVAKWRAHFGSFLKKARRVTAPSSAALAIINRHFELANSLALPHWEAPFRISHIQGNPGQTIHVAVIGAIGRHKGFDILLSCARSALKDGLPLRFVVIGFTHDDASLQSLDNVIITGRYERNDLPSLLTKYGCRIAAFLSPWPETYCYALTEAWRSGLYAVAFDLGAQAERIREAGFGEILPAYSSHPKQINRALLDAARRAETAVPPPGDIGLEYGSVLADYYALASKTKPKAQRKRPK